VGGRKLRKEGRGWEGGSCEKRVGGGEGVALYYKIHCCVTVLKIQLHCNVLVSSVLVTEREGGQ
jgi:hypothetical protein